MNRRATHCPKCESEDIAYDVIHAFYRCDTCQHVWVRPEDDFDFNEAEFLLEQVNQIQPEYPPDYEMRVMCFSDEHPMGYPYDPEEWGGKASPNVIRFVQIGSDPSGMTIVRFESTIPGNVMLPNGFTPNRIFAVMEEGLQARGIKLIKG